MRSSSMAEATLTAPSVVRAPSPLRTKPRLASIMSVASELPPTRLTNAEVAEMAGVSEDWILSRTGIRERRRALPDERLSDYAAAAGARALDRAGISAEDLDLVIVG